MTHILCKVCKCANAQAIEHDVSWMTPPMRMEFRYCYGLNLDNWEQEWQAWLTKNDHLPDPNPEAGGTVTYRWVGDFLLPNYLWGWEDLPEMSPMEQTWYGERHDYLKEHQQMTHHSMLMAGTLFQHCCETAMTASKRMDHMMEQARLSNPYSLDSQGEYSEALQWAGYMNNMKAQARELIYRELIYG